MKLNLGFEANPYAGRYSASSPLTTTTKKRAPKVLSRPQQAYGQGKTTKEVAEELEAKYSIVETFYELEEDSITDLLEDAFADDIEEIMIGGTPTKTGISDKATDKIEQKFRRNLANQRYDGVISGVPTIASLRGVSHLKQHPYAQRSLRPSFIDTGLYQRSFRVWIEED